MDKRCVNCGLRKQSRSRYFYEDNQHLRPIVNRWIAPRTVENGNHLCEECWNLINKAVDPLASLEPKVGHRVLCISCGRSLLRARTQKLKTSTELDVYIFKVIEQWASPFQVKASSVACIACWLKAKRRFLAQCGPFTLATKKVEHLTLLSTPDSKHSCFLPLPHAQTLKSDMCLDYYASQSIQNTLTSKTYNIKRVEVDPLGNIELSQKTQIIKTEVDTDDIIEDVHVPHVPLENIGLSQKTPIIKTEMDTDEFIENVHVPHMSLENRLSQKTQTINTEADTDNIIEDLQLEGTMENGADSQLTSGVSQVNVGYSQLNSRDSQLNSIFMVQVDRVVERQGNGHQENSEESIILPNYYRATATQRQCFVRNCKGRERNLIPKNLKTMLFTKYNYYVLPNNRICQYHLTCSSWDFITQTLADSSQHFTASHIEDFTQLLKNDYLRKKENTFICK